MNARNRNLSIGLASLALLALLALTNVASARACLADVNDDGIVGFNDMVAVLGSWGVCPIAEEEDGLVPEPIACPADFSQDNRVDFYDLTILLLDYGQCGGADE